jgi:hypothetical protein
MHEVIILGVIVRADISHFIIKQCFTTHQFLLAHFLYHAAIPGLVYWHVALLASSLSDWSSQLSLLLLLEFIYRSFTFISPKVFTEWQESTQSKILICYEMAIYYRLISSISSIIYD